MRMSYDDWTRMLARLRGAGYEPAVRERGSDGADAELRRTVERVGEAAELARELVDLVGDAGGGVLLTVSPCLGAVRVSLLLYGAPPAGESESQRALRIARQRLAEAGMADAVRVVEGVVA